MPAFVAIDETDFLRELSPANKTISGVVTDSADAPLVREVVLAIDRGKYRLAETMSAADGSYSFTIALDSVIELAVIFSGADGEDSTIHSHLSPG